MKPLYCGNIEYEAQQSEIERLLGSKYFGLKENLGVASLAVIH
jgi:hypothetical protein